MRNQGPKLEDIEASHTRAESTVRGVAHRCKQAISAASTGGDGGVHSCISKVPLFHLFFLLFFNFFSPVIC